MKTDKSGAAAVLAAMSVIAALAPPVQVVAIIPATENMPGGAAVKPGDVLTIRNGKTVEVLNTDAEGRLVLADGLSLAVEAGRRRHHRRGHPHRRLRRGPRPQDRRPHGQRRRLDRPGAGTRPSGPARRCGPCPCPRSTASCIDSDVADIKNIGGGRYAGALTAGLFLQEFVGDVPWAHLDIAGPARSDDDEGYLPKGGTGFGVRTLVEAVMGSSRRRSPPAQRSDRDGSATGG